MGYPLQPTWTALPFGRRRQQGLADEVDPRRSGDLDQDNEAAWLASTDDEPGFVAALKKGTSLIVTGTSLKGTKTTDTYSLGGVTAAMDAIDKAAVTPSAGRLPPKTGTQASALS